MDEHVYFVAFFRSVVVMSREASHVAVMAAISLVAARGRSIIYVIVLFLYLLTVATLLEGSATVHTTSKGRDGRVLSQRGLCSDKDSCLNVHLNNAELNRLLDGRCNVGESTRADSAERRITFSQLPKTGGSSVREFLIRLMGDRVRGMTHEHFLLAALAEPKNLFTSMLREPVARAISFYSYVRALKTLHKEGLKNKLWAKTYITGPVTWAADPFIQRTMYQDPLGFFLRDIVNISDSITRYDYRNIQQLPHVPLCNFTEGTLDEYLQYTKVMPEKYQCKQHLEVAFIFLKHYEVIGVVEDRESYFKVLFRRAHFPSTITLKDTEIHNNPSTFSITAEERAAMTEHLRDALYCGTVLWKIAGIINQKDLACPL